MRSLANTPRTKQAGAPRIGGEKLQFDSFRDQCLDRSYLTSSGSGYTPRDTPHDSEAHIRYDLHVTRNWFRRRPLPALPVPQTVYSHLPFAHPSRPIEQTATSSGLSILIRLCDRVTYYKQLRSARDDSQAELSNTLSTHSRMAVCWCNGARFLFGCAGSGTHNFHFLR